MYVYPLSCCCLIVGVGWPLVLKICWCCPSIGAARLSGLHGYLRCPDVWVCPVVVARSVLLPGRCCCPVVVAVRLLELPVCKRCLVASVVARLLLPAGVARLLLCCICPIVNQ